MFSENILPLEIFISGRLDPTCIELIVLGGLEIGGHQPSPFYRNHSRFFRGRKINALEVNRDLFDPLGGSLNADDTPLFSHRDLNGPGMRLRDFKDTPGQFYGRDSSGEG